MNKRRLIEEGLEQALIYIEKNSIDDNGLRTKITIEEIFDEMIKIIPVLRCDLSLGNFLGILKK